jgi:hypothetical protein
MKLQPFSDHQRGLFVSVDGPSGAGSPRLCTTWRNCSSPLVKTCTCRVQAMGYRKPSGS